MEFNALIQNYLEKLYYFLEEGQINDEDFKELSKFALICALEIEKQK